LLQIVVVPVVNAVRRVRIRKDYENKVHNKPCHTAENHKCILISKLNIKKCLLIFFFSDRSNSKLKIWNKGILFQK